MLMTENHRSGFIWEHFMKGREAQRAMKLAGFKAAALPAAATKKAVFAFSTDEHSLHARSAGL